MASYLRKDARRGERGLDALSSVGVSTADRKSSVVTSDSPRGVRWPPMVSDAHHRDLSAKRVDVGRGVTNRHFQSAPLDQRPASKLGAADFVAKGWTHRVIGGTKTDAIVEFTSPDGHMREERTIPRGMLPSEEPRTVGKNGRSVLRLGKTRGG